MFRPETDGAYRPACLGYFPVDGVETAGQR
jgi:hypothetical protein